MGSTELFFRGSLCRRAGFTSPARPRGAGGTTRETDSIFSTLSAPRGPRAEGEGEARDWRVPGRFPVGRAERRRDLPCEAVAKTFRRSKKTQFYFVMYQVYAWQRLGRETHPHE